MMRRIILLIAAVGVGFGQIITGGGGGGGGGTVTTVTATAPITVTTPTTTPNIAAPTMVTSGGAANLTVPVGTGAAQPGIQNSNITTDVGLNNLLVPGSVSTGGASGVSGVLSCGAGTSHSALGAGTFGIGCPGTLTNPLEIDPPNAQPAANAIPIFPAPTSNVSQWVWSSVPGCLDSAGNHLNYNSSTQTFTCGTTSSGSSAITTRLVSSGTTDTILTGDLGKLVSYNVTAPIAVTLPQCTSAGFAATWYVKIANIGAGPVIITPTTSTIDGQTSIYLTGGHGLAQGVAEIVCDTGGNYFTDRFQFDPGDTNWVFYRDEFGAFTNGSFTSGQLGWQSTTITNGGTLTNIAGSWPNIGVFQVASSATASSATGESLGQSQNSTFTILGSHAPWQIKYIVKLEQTTNNRMRFCAASSVTLTPNESYCIRLDQNAAAPGGQDTNWTYDTRTGGTSTTAATTTAPDTNFHTLEIASDAVGTIIFKIDGGQRKTFCASGCTVTATISTTAMTMVWIVGNDTTASSSKADMDFFSFKALVSSAATGERQ